MAGKCYCGLPINHKSACAPDDWREQPFVPVGPVEGISAVANYAMSDDWADRAANLIFSRMHLGTEPEPNFTVRKVTVEAWAELIRREWTATFGTGDIRPRSEATQRAYDQGFTEGRRTGNIQLAEQVGELREELAAANEQLENRLMALDKMGEERDALRLQLNNYQSACRDLSVTQVMEVFDRCGRAESALAEARNKTLDEAAEVIAREWGCANITSCNSRILTAVLALKSQPAEQGQKFYAKVEKSGPDTITVDGCESFTVEQTEHRKEKS